MLNFAELLFHPHIYNTSIETLCDWEKNGKAFVIRPSEKINIGRIEKDPDKLQKVYDLGIKDSESQLALLHEYLK